MCFPFLWWLMLFSVLCFYVYTRLQELKIFHVFISFKEVSVSNFCALPVTLFLSLCLSGELMPSKWALVTDRLLVLSRRFSDILSKVQEFLWRLLELHILKMVAFFAVWVALEEVRLYFYFLPTYPPILTPPAYIVMLTDERPLH